MISIYHLVLKMLSCLRLATMPCWEYRSHFSLRILQYAVSIIGLVTKGKGETMVTTPGRLDQFSYLKRLHVQVS
jgi:hypothetical protein